MYSRLLTCKQILFYKISVIQTKCQPGEQRQLKCQLAIFVFPAGKIIFPASSENAVGQLLPASAHGVLPI